MMKISIPIAMLIALAGLASGTMWLYTDPTFFSGLPTSTTPYSFNYQSGALGSFTAADLTPFEILNSPIFPMLGHGFTLNTSNKGQNASPVVSLGSSGTVSIPPQMTFSGALENNLKYAQSKSSIRVGQGGSWTNLNTPWLI